MTSTKRLYLAPDAPYPYESDHYLVMDKIGSDSAVKILVSEFLGGLITSLNRAPLSPAEALWPNDLLMRIRPQAKQDAKDTDQRTT